MVRGAPAPGDDGAPAAEEGGAPGSLVERLRAVHLEMVDAVLGGEGLGRVAELASEAVGGPVAIVVPRLDVAVAAPAASPASAALPALRRYAADRVQDRPVEVPSGLVAEAPIATGDDVVGIVALIAGNGPAGGPSGGGRVPAPRGGRVADRRRGRAGQGGGRAERARLVPGGPALAAGPRAARDRAPRGPPRLRSLPGRRRPVRRAATDRPRHVVATIAEEFPGALAQHLDGRVYALLPAAGGDDAPETTLSTARRLATRLQRHGTVGLSSFYADPGDFPRAIQEAELVLDVLRQSDAPIAEDIGTGTYRLLFRVLASHPEEVRSFYEDTVAPIVRYDDQYRTDLVGTLESYLEQNCNMNATAAAIYAHRHTVAYRLDRVKELTGLDPMQSEDRERLGLGLKAYRIIAPRLPR